MTASHRSLLVTLVLCLVAPLALDGAAAQRGSPRPRLADTAACVDAAQRRTELVPVQIRRLCVATPNATGPVDCYVQATRALLLTDPQGVELCRCTPDLGPIICIRALREAALLTETEMIEACSPTITLDLRADCTPAP